MTRAATLSGAALTIIGFVNYRGRDVKGLDALIKWHIYTMSL